jgi:mono/diheme cytochrome c family protein/glucose/arabinose dehydrogenase
MVLAAQLLWAQQGDKAGEEQPPPPPTLEIPPAPPLSPEEALETFQLPPGFRIEVVAAEPLVESPVAMEFGPDGRLWVVEMRGFMPNVEGEGEQEPVGRVSVLEDLDGDGLMDRSTVFLDGLIMPRALALVQDGVLVAEPPFLWFCRDTNGDGKADFKIEIADDYGSQANPEHTSNGLLRALDNWIYSANHTTRFRHVNGGWEREPTLFRGQWGISQDDFGRLFYNSNSDQFRGDLLPAQYLNRNPNYKAAGGNVRLASDQSTWPSRVTPGINRGYQSHMLRDGKLSRFTAACGPVIYRGKNFPEEFHGNAFVPEPSGNLIRRNILTETDGLITAENAYHQAEFLTSTDERFRPVNLYNGPDGALYIVDMYRGILQHRIYLTTFLRRQILERGLDTPINQGRIYRVVYEGNPLDSSPLLSKANPAELVRALSHPNGWHRDEAQQLLIDRKHAQAVPLLKLAAREAAAPLGRLHALWTLEGFDQLDETVLRAALADAHPKIRAAAVRLSEPLLNSPAQAKLLEAILEMVSDPSADVRLQLALTLGEVSASEAEIALAGLAGTTPDHLYLREAILSSLGGRELEFLGRLLAEVAWSQETAGRAKLLQALAQCVLTERKPERVERLLDWTSRQTGSLFWRQLALLDGALSTLPTAARGQPAPRIKTIPLKSEPALLAHAAENKEPKLQSRIEKLDQLVTWSGKPGAEAEEKTAAPLTPEQELAFEEGKTLYTAVCAACHQPHGQGQDGLAPPLEDAEWVLGSEERLIRIILQGARGPMTVKGKVWELDMPGLGVFNDEQIAAILTYIRREWGHAASPVDPGSVAQIRAKTEDRIDPWTEEELLEIP